MDALQLARFASQFMMPMMMAGGMNGKGGGMFNVMRVVQQSSYAVNSVDPNMMALSSALSSSSGGQQLSVEEETAIDSALSKAAKAVLANLAPGAETAKKKK